MGNEQMKILKVLNVISIILSFGCTLAAVLFLASVGSDSNFLNGIAVILSLFLFVFIGISGVIVESYFKDDNVIQIQLIANMILQYAFIYGVEK